MGAGSTDGLLAQQVRCTARPPRGARPASAGAPAAPAFPVELLAERVDPVTGVRVRRVAVADESDLSPSRESTHAMFALLDEMLRAHPQWRAPSVVDGEVATHGNPAGEWVYASAAMREWRRELVPGAVALYPVQRQASHLPSGAPLDATARRVFLDSIDGIGIRSRARIMSQAVRRVTEASWRSGAPEPATWVSLACGAAVPVLDAVAALRGPRVHLQLVDLDASALAFAARLAAEQGLVEGVDYALHRRDLVRTAVAGSSLVDEVGEGAATVVEALGIFEYFTDASCVRLLRNAYRMLRPGGALVVGNMLSDRRQLHFNQRAAGWPRLHPRSVDQLVGLVRRAGLPTRRTRVSIPEDGVYAVLEVDR
ncbi:class I SAM-dependent methyltransferase family protein [Quadrisphaera sp. DSM 44207]|uniref:class I SAM-dependent methyltransferase family protein n=1 Tax=Quadrisphaera sp. DSM 44207 TaxID=1881057 RepID=UPI000882A2A4|nr:class I SAM-dependent methyltransferase family protein [Quadrisphaera sp. DSM 44207]SDQ40654.1 Putative methyltransferase [Quadrisphaera sp. DSM 44207]